MKLKLNNILAISLLAFSTSAIAGNGNSGGGDLWVEDFVSVAKNEAKEFIEQNNYKLETPVDINEYLKNIDIKKVESRSFVPESCFDLDKFDELKRLNRTDRAVAICYNAKLKMHYVSQQMYPVDLIDIAKAPVVAHEIFRKMGIEGDDYEVTLKLDSTFKSNPYLNICEGDCSRLQYLTSENFKACMAVYYNEGRGMLSHYAADWCLEPKRRNFDYRSGVFKTCHAVYYNEGHGMLTHYAADKCLDIYLEDLQKKNAAEEEKKAKAIESQRQATQAAQASQTQAESPKSKEVEKKKKVSKRHNFK